MSESWLRDGCEGRIVAPQEQCAYSIVVNNLILPKVKQWDIQKIKLIYSWYSVKDYEDAFVWWGAGGLFSMEGRTQWEL